MIRFALRSDPSFPWRLLLTWAVTLALIVPGVREGAHAADAKQKTFQSPEAAAAALVKATRENNTEELMALFGPGSRPLVSSGDEIEDRQRREQFVKAYGERNRLEKGAGGKVTLYIGNDDWPFPIPVVKTGNEWRFDTRAGRDEILSREIGENELSAIQVCLAIVDAQRDFADQMRDRTGQPEYAQKLESTAGARDGLYWEAAQGETPSPLGPLVARARAEGYGQAIGMRTPFHGYLYKIIKAQGADAAGGAYEYIVNGKMIGGFALLAYPAAYGSSGVNSFIMSHEGVAYRKDLGRTTSLIAASMTLFNPDKTWKKVE
ncbi:MAG TPA: DUF2950 domain-containing protein [Syntrophales bacterium]|nr:DUF2950 domain-containing protein [Syntrophales bacterium]